MDLQRVVLLITVIGCLSASATATPIDTTWDLIWAVESCEGDWFLELMSESLRIQMEANFAQLQELAEAEPGVAAEYLLAIDLPVTPLDLQWMTTADFISIVLEGVSLPPTGNIVSEEANLRGRNAQVIFTWLSGFTLDLQMTWEESSWKVTGSSIIQRMF